MMDMIVWVALYFLTGISVAIGVLTYGKVSKHRSNYPHNYDMDNYYVMAIAAIMVWPLGIPAALVYGLYLIVETISNKVADRFK